MGIRKLALIPALAVALIAALLLVPGVAFANDETSTGLAAGTATTPTETEPETEAEVKPVIEPQIKYKAFVGSKWTGWKKNGATIGTTSKQFQIIRIKLTKSSFPGKVKYRIYQRGKGWSKWTSNGGSLGSRGWYIRGIQVKLTGKLAKSYDVLYRAYVKGIGWQPWTTNGGTAGSKGKLGQIQRLKVKLVPRGQAASVANGAYYLSAAKNVNATVQLPGSNTDSGIQMAKTTFSASSTDLRFYVRKQSDGTVALQSCTSGLYLCDAGGAVVQRSDDGTALFRWKISTWKSGYAFTNAQTGNRMRISGGKLVTAAKGGRFALTRTDVLAEGTYTLASAAKGNLLAVEDESTKNGARLLVQGEEETNAEVFKLTRTGTNTYRITNVGSSKRVEVENGSTAENAAVCQNASNSATLQKWKAILKADGTYAFVNRASGKVLSVAGTGKPGSYARSSTDSGAAVQRWKLTAHEAYQKSPQALAEARAWNVAASATSYTNYLITVDCTNHWMCIFKGPKGNRTLLKSWICSTGKPGSGTPTGNYTINGNTQYEFGDGYSCYYATGFIDWVYLFHSVKYYKNSGTILDGRLGEAVSEGCVRLDISNAKWLYNRVNNRTIPAGTRVKIYY